MTDDEELDNGGLLLPSYAALFCDPCQLLTADALRFYLRHGSGRLCIIYMYIFNYFLRSFSLVSLFDGVWNGRNETLIFRWRLIIQ